MKKIALCFVFILSAFTWSAAFAASVCPVRNTVPAKTHIYARTDGEAPWLEYRLLDDVPPLRYDGGAVAEFWEDRGKMSSAYIVEGIQDLSVTTRYCFDTGGNLEAVGFDVRTALGWGHRAEGPVAAGSFAPNSSEFFNLKSGKPVPKPDGVADMPRAVSPVLYMKQNDLPFSALLRVAESKTDKKRKE